MGDSFSSDSLDQASPLLPNSSSYDIYSGDTPVGPQLNSDTVNLRVEAFAKFLPSDPKALYGILDQLLRKRLDSWHYPNLSKLGLWMGYCHAVVNKAADVIDKTEYQDSFHNHSKQEIRQVQEQKHQMDDCWNAWLKAYNAVLTLLPHNSSEEQEPRIFQSRAEAQKAIELAESICHLHHPTVTPQSAPSQIHSDYMPPLAPQRPGLEEEAPLSAREPEAQVVEPSTFKQAQPHIVEGEAGKHFKTPEEALKSWAQNVWGPSKQWAIEFAGKLYKNWDGTWSYTPSHPGSENSSNPEKGMPYVLTHGNPLKNYDIHTHGDYRKLVVRNDGSSYYRKLTNKERESVDKFSDRDKGKSDRSGNPQFMLTPGGIVSEYIPDPIGRFLGGLNGDTPKIGNLNNGIWNRPSDF